MSQSNQPKITMLYLPEELDDYGLDAYAFRVFAHIFRVHAETGAGCSEPIPLIASNCGIGIKRVYAALKTLIDYRLVSKENRSKRPSIYTPNPPEEWTGTASPKTPIQPPLRRRDLVGAAISPRK